MAGSMKTVTPDLYFADAVAQAEADVVMRAFDFAPDQVREIRWLDDRIEVDVFVLAENGKTAVLDGELCKATIVCRE